MNKKVYTRTNDDGDDYEPLASQFLQVSVRTNVSHRFDIYLDEEIGPVSYYRNVVRTLEDASEDDIVVLHINSPGGRLDATKTIIEALKSTEAHTVALIVGHASSAASIICMYCQDVIVTDSAEALIHCPRGGTGYGKVQDVLSSSQQFMRSTERLFKEAYAGLLSPEELSEVIAGKELFLDCDELRERFAQRDEYLLKLHEGEMEQDEPDQPGETASPAEVRSQVGRNKTKEK